MIPTRDLSVGLHLKSYTFPFEGVLVCPERLELRLRLRAKSVPDLRRFLSCRMPDSSGDILEQSWKPYQTAIINRLLFVHCKTGTAAPTIP